MSCSLYCIPVKIYIPVLLLTSLARLSAQLCNWICCDCDALENATKTTCTNTTNIVYVPVTSTDTGAIIGAAGGGIVFGSVVTILVFVCIWRAVCKETSRMITNPVYNPGEGAFEENIKEQNRENVGYSEIGDVTLNIRRNLSVQREPSSSSKRDVDHQNNGLEKKNESGKYDRLELVVRNKMDGYEPMESLNSEQKEHRTLVSDEPTVDGKEQSDDYFIVEKK